MKIRARFREQISTNEGRAELGALAVLAGLVIEVALAFKFRTHKSFLEEWGPLIADALIAAGVYAEIHFGRKASNESAERAAESNRIASEAQLEIARLKKQLGPRQIDSEIFLAELAGQPKAPLEILYSPDDPDSWNLALRTMSLMVEAGWVVDSPIPIPRRSDMLGNPSSVIAGGYPSGVTISVNSLEENDKPGTAYTALWNAFWKGLDAGGMFTTRNEGIPEGILRVIIAPRE
jgi:hypothetical protein